MTKLRLSIVTVGCRSNQADSAWLGRSLDPSLIEVVGPDQAADVTVVNSCAVTSAAERDVRRAINRARRISGERTTIILTGCMVRDVQHHEARSARAALGVGAEHRASSNPFAHRWTLRRWRAVRRRSRLSWDHRSPIQGA